MSRILVVDDEADIRDILIEFLSDHGYQAEGAEDGRAALRLVGKFKPQVILLDIAMPGLNGIETLKRLRQEAPGAAVIMISGHADHNQALETLNLGAYDFIQKPLDFHYLERTLLAKIVTLDPKSGAATFQEADGDRRRSTGQRGR